MWTTVVAVLLSISFCCGNVDWMWVINCTSLSIVSYIERLYLISVLTRNVNVSVILYFAKDHSFITIMSLGTPPTPAAWKCQIFSRERRSRCARKTWRSCRLSWRRLWTPWKRVSICLPWADGIALLCVWLQISCLTWKKVHSILQFFFRFLCFFLLIINRRNSRTGLRSKSGLFCSSP